MITLFVHIYDRAHFLDRTLKSLRFFSEDTIKEQCRDIELLVVDDSSSDDVASILRQYTDLFTVRLVTIDSAKCGIDFKTHNPALPISVGFLRAKHDWVLRFQPETILLQDIVATCLHNQVDRTILFGETVQGTSAYREEVWGGVDAGRFDCLQIDKDHTVQNKVGDSTVCDGWNTGWLMVPNYPYVFYAQKKSIVDTGLIDPRFVSGFACDDDYMMHHWGKCGYQMRVVDGLKNYHAFHGRSQELDGLYGVNMSLLQTLKTMTADQVRGMFQENARICENSIVGEVVL